MDQKSSAPAAPRIRRIVTGHDAAGGAVVMIDDLAGNHKFPDPNVSSTLMWSTIDSPTRFDGDEDAGARILGTAPPERGSRFTIMEFKPGHTYHGLHRTDTVDYVICLTGRMDMFLDESRFITMEQGDVLIQRGTYHGWINRSDSVCRLAVVLIDALPKREGSMSGSANAR